jgi:hypothetical protein
MTSLPCSPAVELHISSDGVIEIWRAGELLGLIRATPAGLDVALGDAEPAADVALPWHGQPFRLRFELPPAEFY